MKKILLLIVVSITLDLYSQYTLIPDQNFEYKLVLMGYDNDLDGQVMTANINSITNLNIPDENIADLTGIQDFTALDTLKCSGNILTSLDLSNNTNLMYLECYSNQLTSLNVSQNIALTNLICYNNLLISLDVSNNIALTRLECGRNQLTSLDVSNNSALVYLVCKGYQDTGGFGNNLTSLDVSYNTLLTHLYCGGNSITSIDLSNNTALDVLWCGDNQLSTLDVSQNTSLTTLYCSYNQLIFMDLTNNIVLNKLRCNDNQLECLNVKNGNNLNFDLQAAFDATGNPNLTCITVDNVSWSTINWTVGGDEIDPQTSFSVNCGGSCSVGINELTTNPIKELSKIIDFTGREIQYQKNIMMFYIYKDGTSQRVIEFE